MRSHTAFSARKYQSTHTFSLMLGKSNSLRRIFFEQSKLSFFVNPTQQKYLLRIF